MAAVPASTSIHRGVLEGRFGGIRGLDPTTIAALADSFETEYGEQLEGIMAATTESAPPATPLPQLPKNEATNILASSRDRFTASMYSFLCAALDPAFWPTDTLLQTSKSLMETMARKKGTRDERDYILWIDGVLSDCVEAIGPHLALILRHDERVFVHASKVENLRVFGLQTRARTLTETQKRIIFKHLENVHKNMKRYSMYRQLPPTILSAIRCLAEQMMFKYKGGMTPTTADLNPLKLGIEILTVCSPEDRVTFSRMIQDSTFSWADMFDVLQSEMSVIGVSVDDIVKQKVDPSKIADAIAAKHAADAAAAASASAASATPRTAASAIKGTATKSAGSSAGAAVTKRDEDW